VTVRDWVDSRTPPPPAVLLNGVSAALGSDVDADVERTAEVCLLAAERALRAIIQARRFGRDGALDLLVVDALTTYAYEYASAAAPAADVGIEAEHGIRRFGDIAADHG
jgi:hypothetical protein